MGIRVTARSWIARCVLAAVWLLAAANARAAGTPAGPPISNTATVSYDVGADSYTQSATAVFTVDERIDVVVTWQDAVAVVVAPADVDRLLTFLVTNTGNGNESFALAIDAGIAGDQFDPTIARLYVDANDSGSFEPGLDPLYQPGVNDPLLAADAARVVFALCDIPPAVSERKDIPALLRPISEVPPVLPAGVPSRRAVLPAVRDRRGTDQGDRRQSRTGARDREPEIRPEDTVSLSAHGEASAGGAGDRGGKHAWRRRNDTA